MPITEFVYNPECEHLVCQARENEFSDAQQTIYIYFHSGIQVKCEGKAQTEWSEEEKDDDDVKYVSKEKYFEEKKILVGRGKKFDMQLCFVKYKE